MREKMRTKTESQLLYQKIFEESSDAIAIADEDFDIEKANPAFKALTGFPVSALKGKRLSVLSPKKKVKTARATSSQAHSSDASDSPKTSLDSKARSKI